MTTKYDIGDILVISDERVSEDILGSELYVSNVVKIEISKDIIYHLQNGTSVIEEADTSYMVRIVSKIGNLYEGNL